MPIVLPTIGVPLCWRPLVSGSGPCAGRDPHAVEGRGKRGCSQYCAVGGNRAPTCGQRSAAAPEGLDGRAGERIPSASNFGRLPPRFCRPSCRLLWRWRSRSCNSNSQVWSPALRQGLAERFTLAPSSNTKSFLEYAQPLKGQLACFVTDFSPFPLPRQNAAAWLGLSRFSAIRTNGNTPARRGRLHPPFLSSPPASSSRANNRKP